MLLTEVQCELWAQTEFRDLQQLEKLSLIEQDSVVKGQWHVGQVEIGLLIVYVVLVGRQNRHKFHCHQDEYQQSLKLQMHQLLLLAMEGLFHDSKIQRQEPEMNK